MDQADLAAPRAMWSLINHIRQKYFEICKRLFTSYPRKGAVKILNKVIRALKSSSRRIIETLKRSSLELELFPQYILKSLRRAPESAEQYCTAVIIIHNINIIIIMIIITIIIIIMTIIIIADTVLCHN